MAKSLRSLATTALLASAISLGSGCASLSQYPPQNSKESAQQDHTSYTAPIPRAQEYAETNTVPISSGSQEYRFKQANVGEIIAENESYVLVPLSPTMTIETNGKTLDALLVLDAKFIPHNNSRYIRTQDELKVLDNGEVYYAANAYNDGSGNIKVNSSSEEKQSFFIVSSLQFPQSITRNELLIEQQRLLDNVYRKAGYVRIGNENYVSLPAENEFGPDRVFIPLSKAKAMYVEDRRTDHVKVKFGLNGPGYYLMNGIEREMPARQPTVQEMQVTDVEATPNE